MATFMGRFAGWLAALAVGGWLAATAPAETSPERNREASGLVARALHHEVAGKNSPREGLLQTALQEAPDLPAARWHSGYVRMENRWVRFDEAPRLVEQDERLATYRRIRAKSPDTVEGHLAMAEWCEKRKMPEHRRAHLCRVLQFDPEQPEARRLLGYRFVEGSWISPDEMAQAGARASAASAALRQWQPKLMEIRNGLTQRNPKAQQAAAARLAAIDDPAAVPAIELVLSTHDELTAMRGVEKLSQMSANEASLALARQAVFSPWPSVREIAARRLKPRKVESYVPALLSVMRSPIQSRAELIQEPGGRLIYRHAFYQEGQERNDLAVLDSLYTLFLIPPNERVPVIQGPAGSREGPVGSPADQADWLRIVQQDAAIKARMREAALAQQNALVAVLNERVCHVLKTATGEDLPAKPENWWDWWIAYNEVYVPGYKPLNTVYRKDQYTAATPTFAYLTPRHGCLAAGTLVWTESGPVPVEQVQVGDRVLSRNPETGELAYKPVLGTTVRDEARLLRLAMLDDSVKCTHAHPFWIAGKGWVRAREIKPGMHFHGAEGTTPFEKSEEAPAERVHNLIVADFHSYFVTNAMIFSHDITRRKPTNLLVPGLAER